MTWACPTPGKIAHVTREGADSHRRGLLSKGGSPDLKVYACGPHWHVGHSAVALRERIRRSGRGIRFRRTVRQWRR